MIDFHTPLAQSPWHFCTHEYLNQRTSFRCNRCCVFRRHGKKIKSVCTCVICLNSVTQWLPQSVLKCLTQGPCTMTTLRCSEGRRAENMRCSSHFYHWMEMKASGTAKWVAAVAGATRGRKVATVPHLYPATPPHSPLPSSPSSRWMRI